MDKNGLMVYLSRDNNRIYWVGRKSGKSANLVITFNDDKKMITVNKSNRIIFHNLVKYDQIKKKAIYYKLLKANENHIVFEEI